jgi:uncharacterized protein (DUF488 family)
MATIYTIGHGLSYRSEIIAAVGTRLLIDVRSKPYSRWNPSCNMKAMQEALGDRYLSLPELGGLGGADPVQRQAAIERVRAILETEDVVLMCSESDHTKCHRSALSDEIAAGKFAVVHLDNPNTIQKPKAEKQQSSLFDR